MSLACHSFLFLSMFSATASMKLHQHSNATIPGAPSISTDDAGVCPEDSDRVTMLQSRVHVDTAIQPADESKSNSREPLALEMQWSGGSLEQKGHEAPDASASQSRKPATAMCARGLFCTHWSALYTEIDCDGDGVKDPYCSDWWSTGFISSASNCQSNWPNGKCQASYVPGTPGATWTTEEMLIVRAKLNRMFNEGQTLVWEAANSYFGHGEWFKASWYSGLNAAKVLRLGFHDCLKYKDGTGGCDGCLQWDRMEHRFWNHKSGEINSTDRPDGGNNGLTTVVHVLEAIYMHRNFPGAAPRLPISLQESGKSRADLWAFAVIEAVRYTMEMNNWACDEPDIDGKVGWGHCPPRLGESDCKFAVPVFSFQTGRKDCISTSSPGFKTNKVESHPNPHWNGKKVVDFMQHDFGFSGQETVAIMGAHTIGAFTYAISLFRYTWKTQSSLLFNNGYYRNLAMKPDWYFPAGGNIAHRPCGKNIVDNSTGERPVARFKTFAWGDTDVGGPVQWVQEKLVCPQCHDVNLLWGKPYYEKCCKPKMSTQFEANLNQTLAELKAIDYAQGPLNKPNCPANFEAIPDRAACVQGANSLQRPFEDDYSHRSMTDHPYGCFVDAQSKIHFNPNGSKNQSAIQYSALCRRNALPYNHDAWASGICPAGSEIILDEGACKLAAQDLQKKFNPWRSVWAPRGCLLGFSEVYFNPQGSTTGWWNLAPLCRKHIPKPSTAVCETTTGQACVFPFKYNGKSYSGCAIQGNNESWCYTKVDQTGHGVPGHRGTCASSCRLDYKELEYKGCDASCQIWMFIPGRDECMLSSDMGLYWDFNVSNDGIPFGCKGFENFNEKTFLHPRGAHNTVPECSLNALSVPAGTASLSQVVELYANNQTQFVNDFALVLTKMLANGYSNLTSAPAAGMRGFSCPYQWASNSTRFYNCQRPQ